MASKNEKRVPASFRDPSGFVFRDEQGTLFRQVNRVCESDYRHLMDSGLYQDLVTNGLLVKHEDVGLENRLTDEACQVIRPEEIEFVSYPYEWCCSALKHAAILTLEVQRRAMGFGMCLKDASAYNVQFSAGRPIFIDTLSFERYYEGQPWVAYSQFCRHFLAPLALMANINIDLGRLLTLNVDGIPLDLASKMLPWRSCFDFGLLFHLHLHARMIKRYSSTSAGSVVAGKTVRISKANLLSLLDSLKRTVRRQKWTPHATEWRDYYQTHSYTAESADRKKRIVLQYLQRSRPKTVWDLGANNGQYSRLASTMGATTIAFDIDPACVEMNYLSCLKNKDNRLLALRQDLVNPSSAIGWAHEERQSLADRGPVDVVMALALVHHLSIGNNLPFAKVARFFAQLGHILIIEFVPKTDCQVQRLLSSRQDIFSGYTQEEFEAAFREYFTIVDSAAVEKDGRVVYLMSNRKQSI
jgi:hypothetical protein